MHELVIEFTVRPRIRVPPPRCLDKKIDGSWSRPVPAFCLLHNQLAQTSARMMRRAKSGSASRRNQQAGSLCSPEYFPERVTSLWKRGSLAVTAGKLRLWPGNLDKFMAADLLVSGTAGLCVTAQTLDPVGATQE